MSVFTEQQAKIAALITSHTGVEADKITADADFADDIGCDSLDMVELTMMFEEEFNIEITDDEAGRVETVQQAFDLIASKTNG